MYILWLDEIQYNTIFQYFWQLGKEVTFYSLPSEESEWEFIRELNGMEWNDHKGMEKNGMEWNVFK